MEGECVSFKCLISTWGLYCVLHHLVEPCQTSVVWAVVVSVVPMVMSSAITASCCQLCVTCVELCARHFPRRDSSYIRSFLCLVPPTLSILSRTMALARENQKRRLPGECGQSSVFGCIMIFRSGEVKVACDSIVYGHGYYKMLPVLYEPKTNS